MRSSKWLHKPPLPLVVEELHRVDNHHEEEGNEAGEEKDAAVQVEVEAEADDLAHEFAKDPVLPTGIVVYQEEKAGEIQQVCEHQLEHNDGAALPRPHLEAVNTNRNGVSQEAHQEDDAVHNGEVQSLQTDFHASAGRNITFSVLPGGGVD